ncbi:MAG: 6-carboxytetrahydropterin synthase QueD [Deltaproteobacteria bacterium]|nr:6-carboxytetrahydropterin synthase QueD [Deltaproteobacteria bacterium]
MRLIRKFRLECAHRLPRLPEGHKCWRLHGHSYVVEVTVEGPVDPVEGWVMDFDRMDGAFAAVHEALDHRYLNEVPGLANPTSENLARWIWERLREDLPLVEVRVDETCDAACVYRGGE